MAFTFPPKMPTGPGRSTLGMGLPSEDDELKKKKKKMPQEAPSMQGLRQAAMPTSKADCPGM